MEAPRAIEETDARRELLFCLLGGHGISYELSHSAAEVLFGRGVFSHCARQGDRLQRYVQDLLGRPWYEPRRRDGTGRRYRYPKRKAVLVRRADDWLRREAPSGLLAALSDISDAPRRRDWLCGCPGVGPKTASWVLRNLGLGEQLAILDVHILRALEQAGRMGTYRLPRDYEVAEAAFLSWSRELGAPASAFDLLLWQLGRGDL
jgi:thermostable 8-oxoguanine DNA glycosylase